MAKKLQKLLGRQPKPENLTFWRIFAVQIILFFVIYGIMLAPRFSTDSYSDFFLSTDSVDGLLVSGRVGTVFIYRVLLSLGFNLVTHSPIFTAVFTLTVSWSAAVLFSLLKPYFLSSSPNWLTVLLLEFGIVIGYANIYFAELYFFSDAAMMYTFAVFFMTLALILFCHRNQIIGTILAMACLYLCLSFYQAFLGFFMIFGAMTILVRHDVPGRQWKKQDIKPLFLDLLRLAVVGGGSSVASALTSSHLAVAGSSKEVSFGVADILNSIRQVVWHFTYYYPSGYPNYLTGFLRLIFVLSGPVLLCLLIGSFSKRHRKQYPLSSAIITLLILFAGLMSVFAPHFVSKNVWMTPRSICSFFAVFTVMAVVIGCNYVRNGKAMPWVETAVVLLLLTVNIVGIEGIALDQMKINRKDKAEAEVIVRYIQQYEAESGQSVDTISWRPDSRYTWTYPEIKYMFMDMNVRAGARSWSLIDCINYYAGRPFKSETMPDEIWATYFMGQEWDSFRPEEQIRFDGNKMYFMVY